MKSEHSVQVDIEEHISVEQKEFVIELLTQIGENAGRSQRLLLVDAADLHARVFLPFFLQKGLDPFAEVIHHDVNLFKRLVAAPIELVFQKGLAGHFHQRFWRLLGEFSQTGTLSSGLYDGLLQHLRSKMRQMKECRSIEMKMLEWNWIILLPMNHLFSSFLSKGSRCFWAILFIPFFLCAQANQTDTQGRKQGSWKKYHPSGSVRFEGTFRDDVPVGTFVYYHEKGARRAVNEFRGSSGICYSKQYSEEAVLMIEGKYIGQKRDSIWRTYDVQGRLILEEDYKDDKRSGWSISYHKDGSLAEKKFYKDDLEEGLWVRKIENGTTVVRAEYKEGVLSGPAKYWNTAGTPICSGNYAHGWRTGWWIEYNEKGRPAFRVKFKRGREVERRSI